MKNERRSGTLEVEDFTVALHTKLRGGIQSFPHYVNSFDDWPFPGGYQRIFEGTESI